MTAGHARRALSVVAGVATMLGCAPIQIVPLELRPVPLTIFVDGEELEDGSPVQLELRADRPHVLFFKKEGYRSEQLVLESRLVAGKPKLEPERVSIRLAPLTSTGRSLKMELDE
jgi:hypothetical protein